MTVLRQSDILSKYVGKFGMVVRIPPNVGIDECARQCQSLVIHNGISSNRLLTPKLVSIEHNKYIMLALKSKEVYREELMILDAVINKFNGYATRLDKFIVSLA